LLYHGKTKVDPLGSNTPNSRDQSQMYSSDGLLPEGSKFGGYIVGPCIGHGGMARIYRAEHEGLRRSVALKVLLDGFAQDHEGHERFLREGRIAAAIKHPNVVNIFDVGFQDSTPYLVMELLEGQDLEALMYSQGSMPEAALVDIIVPIVAGLAAVHDAGVVHRDLKPGNIFLHRGRNEEIEPKLLDFGISKAAESEQFKLTTARGLLMGTPLYMSPEGIQGGEITPLSDQYSLGVVLYECCTGFNPFAADTLAETVRRVTMGDFPPVAQQNPAVSKRMARIVGRAMSLDPAHRFASLREMGRELLYLAGQRTRITWSLSFGEVSTKRTKDALALSATNTPAPPPRSPHKLSSLTALGFLVLLFGVAGALLWSARGDNPADPAVALQSLKGSAAQTPAPPSIVPGVTVPAAAPSPSIVPSTGSSPSTVAAAPAPSAPAKVELTREPPAAGGAQAAPSAQGASAQPSAAQAPLVAPSSASATQKGAAPRREANGSRPNAERVRAALGDDEDRRRRGTRPATGRRRAAPQPAPRPEPAKTAEAEPEKPAWVVDEELPAPVRQQRRNTAVGTNNAPIFE
jgi:eukaryotic-like serine/threonine-protein kinase